MEKAILVANIIDVFRKNFENFSVLRLFLFVEHSLENWVTDDWFALSTLLRGDRWLIFFRNLLRVFGLIIPWLLLFLFLFINYRRVRILFRRIGLWFIDWL